MDTKITSISTKAYKVPTDKPEADGTFEWDSTEMVTVEIEGGGKKGIGYTYAQSSTANFIDSYLKNKILGKDFMQIENINSYLHKNIRNNGNCGIAYMALSALDTALWDLKAKILNLPLCELLGRVRDKMLIYGSGGFTSYSIKELQFQLSGWAKSGLSAVKMKIGQHPDEDIERIKAARQSIGNNTLLFVDANGAYTIKKALKTSEEFNKYNVSWYEEPVSSDNLEGLSFIKENVPAGVNISAGEYGYNLQYFRNMLESESVDVLQADATRCGGISGFIKTGILCEAFQIPFSSHCAPALHLHIALCLPAFYIAEYFHDHVRIENDFFDGAQQPVSGFLYPDLTRPGLGLELKEKDVERYRIY